MNLTPITFTVLDSQRQPLALALLNAVSPNGNWQALTDDHGQFIANLAPGHYDVTATKDGYQALTVSTDIGAVSITLQSNEQTGDMIDLSQAIVTSGSVDVRGWPIGSPMLSVGLSAVANMTLDFTKRNGPQAWPFIIGSEGGEIQYTLWVGSQCGVANGPWYISGVIRCISRAPDDNYVPTGPALVPGQLPQNWYYFAGSPLATYQPQPGELVAWFLTSGDQRLGDIHDITERTNVALTPFSAGTFTF